VEVHEARPIEAGGVENPAQLINRGWEWAAGNHADSQGVFDPSCGLGKGVDVLGPGHDIVVNIPAAWGSGWST
jgi:hypothetical protein